MQQEISELEAVGKTVKAFIRSASAAQLIVQFTDDTFTVFGARHDHFDAAASIDQERLDLLNFGDASLIEASIIAKDALAREHAKSRAAANKSIRRRDRREYKRLKAKFEIEL